MWKGYQLFHNRICNNKCSRLNTFRWQVYLISDKDHLESTDRGSPEVSVMTSTFIRSWMVRAQTCEDPTIGSLNLIEGSRFSMIAKWGTQRNLYVYIFESWLHNVLVEIAKENLQDMIYSCRALNRIMVGKCNFVPFAFWLFFESSLRVVAVDLSYLICYFKALLFNGYVLSVVI